MRLAILLCLPLVLACELERAPFVEALALEGPIAVGERLLWLDPPRDRLLSVNPGAALAKEEAKQRRSTTCVELPENARGPSAGTKELWLLGEEGGASKLLRFDPSSGKTRAIPLSRSFDRIWLGPGENHALLSAEAGRAPLPGQPAARDLRALGVVNLATLRNAAFDDLRPARSGGGGAGAIRSRGVRAGPLDLSGWLFSLGAGLRF